jgi:hypothetical protein
MTLAAYLPQDRRRALARGESLPEPDRPANGAGGATVDSAELFIMESFPVQVSLLISGNLADGCTTIREIRQERSGAARLHRQRPRRHGRFPPGYRQRLFKRR